jgi:RNA polymerase sigma factor (sigma-70 family)
MKLSPTADGKTDQRRVDLEPDPQDLLDEFVRGDADAFEAIFRRHQDEVYGWILRMVRDRGAAEDLTVETFWRIHQARARFDPQHSFGAWTRRIATNVALDHLKLRKPHVELPPHVASRPAADAAVQGEVAKRIENAFRSLSARLQVVARLALIEEQPYSEIADALDLSVGAVKTRVFRAVRQLQPELRDLGEQL